MSNPDQTFFVYVVDDHEDVRIALEALLTTVGFRTRVFASGEEFLELAAELADGIVLLDLRLPGLNGQQVLERLAAFHPKFGVIVITAHGEMETAVRAMKAGALNFIQKPLDDEALLQMIERERAQLEASRVTMPECTLGRLTERERQVALALGRGLSNKQIAAELGISVRTVEMHRSRAMQRLGTRTFADFLRLVLQAS